VEFDPLAIAAVGYAVGVSSRFATQVAFDHFKRWRDRRDARTSSLPVISTTARWTTGPDNEQFLNLDFDIRNRSDDAVLIHSISIKSPTGCSISADQAALIYHQPISTWIDGPTAQIKGRLRGNSEPHRSDVVAQGTFFLAVKLPDKTTPDTIKAAVEISFEPSQLRKTTIHTEFPCPAEPPIKL
jgi:hypothetical protein